VLTFSKGLGAASKF